MEDTYFLIRYDYRRNFLCLQCRKSVEQPNVSQLATQNGDEDLLFKAFTKSITKTEKKYLQKTYFDLEFHCPDCQQKMVEIPLDYKIPPKRSHLKWKRIKAFFNAKGYVHRCIPTSKKAFGKLLEFELESTKFRLKNLQNFKNIDETYHQAEHRFVQEINAIEEEIKKLNTQ